jgi:hypothetical protein
MKEQKINFWTRKIILWRHGFNKEFVLPNRSARDPGKLLLSSPTEDFYRRK